MSFHIAKASQLSTRYISTSTTLRALNRTRAISLQLPRASTTSVQNIVRARNMSSSSIPSTMKGVIIEKTGGTEVLQYKTDLPVPQPKEGQVLLKNDFIGINYIDTYFRTGLYPAPNGFPYILGREASGTIQAIGSGETHGLQVGDRIVSLSQETYTEYTAVPALHSYKLPDNVSCQDAAAGVLQGLTALSLVRESYAVQKGDWILVYAAAGGVGLWLVQLLKQIGAKVIATCSTSKVELVKSHGADIVVDYSKGAEGMKEVARVVKEATGGKGCAAVYDGVGKDTFDTSLECVARKGTVASFGNASGAVPPLTIARLSPKSIKLLRPTLFAYIAERQEWEAYLKELCELMGSKKIDLRVHEIYPLEEVARAHNDLEGRKTTGKLLLKT